MIAQELPLIDDVPARGNFVIRKGIALDRVLQRKNTDGTPVDISGQTFVGKIMSVDGLSTVATLTVSVVDGPNGKFRVFLASATTATLTVGRLPLYITFTTADPETFMLFLGHAFIQAIVS